MILSIVSIFPVALMLALPLSSNPLSLGIWVLIIAFSCAVVFRLRISSWVAIITFLVYVGGMMVIFSYFAALTPNYRLDIKSIVVFFGVVYLVIIPIFINPAAAIRNSSLRFLFSWESISFLFFLGLLLFFTLVAVVKLRRMPSGPLRPFR